MISGMEGLDGQVISGIGDWRGTGGTGDFRGLRIVEGPDRGGTGDSDGNSPLQAASAVRREGQLWAASARKVGVRVGGARQPSALDTFLTARWGLHVRQRGRTRYVPNTHEPWPLHDVDAVEVHDDLLASVGLPELAGRPPDHTAFSPGVHTEFGLPTDARLGRAGPRTLDR